MFKDMKIKCYKEIGAAKRTARVTGVNSVNLS
jgi:hypothetical protein